MVAAGIVFHHFQIILARVGKVAQVALALGESPVDIRVVGIENEGGFEARQRTFKSLLLR